MAASPQHPGEDTALVGRVRAGSSEALGELYRRHARAVYQLAYRLTSSAQDAEDVLQDTFVGLPRALERYDERGRFEPWLKRVAARTALMRLRARKRRREEPMEALPERGAGEAEPVIDRLVVRRALDRMPESLRVVYLLREVEGYSHAEIADLLEITSGASAARLSRAWAFLRKEVARS